MNSYLSFKIFTSQMTLDTKSILQFMLELYYQDYLNAYFLLKSPLSLILLNIMSGYISLYLPSLFMEY